MPDGDAAALREVDAFVQRFQQMVEHMTHRLYGAIYRTEELGERPPPLRRLLHLLEGTGVVGSADEWAVHIEIRNRLVHEYPMDVGDRTQALEDAQAASHAILADFDAALAHITQRKLLGASDDD